MKKKIKAVAVVLCLLAACGDATVLPAPNLQEGVITQQTAVDNTFPNVGAETTIRDKDYEKETQKEEKQIGKQSSILPITTQIPLGIYLLSRERLSWSTTVLFQA